MIYKNDGEDDTQNFWISYADLMAGLLFVFILLIGAIVVKYVFIQTDLQAIRVDLEKEKAALNMSEDALADKKSRLQQLNEKLQSSKDENIHLAFELGRAQRLYEESQSALRLSDEALGLSEEKKREMELVYQAKITAKVEEIRLDSDEIETLKQLLFDYELQEKETTQKNSRLLAEAATAKEREDKSVHTLKLKDGELALLEEKLMAKSKAHQKLVEDLNITKVKIRNLTGMKIKVASTLKDAMGDSIHIDPKSGAMRFSSNILFNQGEYTLKEGSKRELKQVLDKYIHTLLLDDSIRKHIDQITIEGHTNSDGSYLYNLQLSQKRALAVMEFLYSLDFSNEQLFRKYLSASGRAYADPVFNGEKEDKDASRRIEIKFRLKNEQAIKELESFLNR